jgi:ABC-2 type transport system ATP-binding protein
VGPGEAPKNTSKIDDATITTSKGRKPATPVVNDATVSTPKAKPADVGSASPTSTAESESTALRATEAESARPALAPVGPAASAVASASAWAKRVASASNARVIELRESLAAARVARLADVQNQTVKQASKPAAPLEPAATLEPVASTAWDEALAELAKTGQDPDIESATVTPAIARTMAEASPTRIAQDVVLSVAGLTKRFDDTLAVADLDLEVRAGDFYGIVGPNGAGKTTTLSIITGLLRPDSGTVIVHGSNVWSDPVVAKRNMGVLPDRLRLFDRLTGAQLLYYAGTLRGLDGATVRKRSADLARAFGLEEAMGRLVSDYSAGMTKKVALAAAMIHSPRLLVLDEPFESVDPVSAATVTDILKKYAAAGGTVVLSSHSMDLVQRICDHVAVVVNGEILADGTMDEVRDGMTLEDRFVQLAGGLQKAEGLQWLHNFST